MITEYIRYQLTDYTPAELVEAYAAAASHLNAASQCLAYDLAQCVEDETTFILRIDWESAQAHMEGFRKGPHFPPFLAAVRPFISEIAEMRHYRTTTVASVGPT